MPRRAGLGEDRRIGDLTTTELTVTHASTVTQDQIDHLGHMNVRFYGVNAAAGSAALVAALGGGAGDGPELRTIDAYTRHHREQLLGATLVVRSGVVDVAPDRLALYHELTDERSGMLAATFVHRLRAASPSGGVLDLPDHLVRAARDRCGPPPAHGATRSISLDTDPLLRPPSLDELRDHGLAIRKVRTIGTEECNEAGTFVWAMAPGLTWGGEPVDDRAPVWLHEGPDGERMGWASMETRMCIRRLPNLGDRIQSFSAVLALADKTSHRIQWAYDVERADLLTTFEVVNLAFDITARRPMSIPARQRAAEAAVLRPDLRPAPADPT